MSKMWVRARMLMLTAQRTEALTSFDYLVSNGDLLELN
jgi:hypothetical protein